MKNYETRIKKLQKHVGVVKDFKIYYQEPDGKTYTYRENKKVYEAPVDDPGVVVFHHAFDGV